jgi:hypothetical protein
LVSQKILPISSIFASSASAMAGSALELVPAPPAWRPRWRERLF